MKTIVFSLVLSAALLMAVPQISLAQATVEATIRGLEKAETTAFIGHDYAALDKLWAPDFKVNNPRNTVSLSATEVKGQLKAGRINHVSIERNIENLFLQGNDMVVVMGNEVVKEPEDRIINRRFTNIWMRTNGEWKLSFRHANIICEQ